MGLDVATPSMATRELMSCRVLASGQPPPPYPEPAFQEAPTPSCPGRRPGRKDSVALAAARQEGALRCQGEAISLPPSGTLVSPDALTFSILSTGGYGRKMPLPRGRNLGC